MDDFLEDDFAGDDFMNEFDDPLLLNDDENQAVERPHLNHPERSSYDFNTSGEGDSNHEALGVKRLRDYGNSYELEGVSSTRARKSKKKEAKKEQQ